MIVFSNDTRTKVINEDFVVKEISYLPSAMNSNAQQGDYAYLTLQKSGYTTFEAIRLLAEFLSISQTDIYCQGLKDEDGITTQTVCLAAHDVTKQQIDDFGASLDSSDTDKWIQLSLLGYSPEKIREKCLHGNIFDITLRNVDESLATKIFNDLQDPDDFILINYYDQQRFGLPGGPYLAHRIGEAIVNNDEAAMRSLYIQSGNAALDGFKNDDDIDFEKIHPGKLKFFVSAYGSHQWNAQLSAKMDGQRQIEIFGGYKLNIPNTTASELPPILAIDAATIDRNRQLTQKSKERATFVSTTLFASAPQTDELHKDKYKLRICFSLPAGSFATMVIKQLMQRYC